MALRLRALASACLVLAISSSVSYAQAQDEDDDGDDDRDRRGNGLTSSGFPEPPPPPPPTDARPRRVHADSAARFRAGVSALFGSYLIDREGVATTGIQGRVGAQVTRVLGIYAAPGVMVGWQDWEDAITRLSIAGIVDATVEDLFYIGGGPELFRVLGERDGTSFDETHAFALRMRTGFAFGSMRSSRRHAFTIGADVNVDFYDGAVGWSPALSLGYDAF